MIIDDCACAVRTFARSDQGWRTATHSADELPALYVRVRCEGVAGFGASAAHPSLAPLPELLGSLTDVLLPAVRGRDLADARGMLSGLREAYPSRALIALDLALWDLLGNLAGVSCETLWGGTQREEMVVARMVGLKAPEQLVSEVGDLVADGIRAVKIKIGDGVSNDLERIRVVRAAFGDGLVIQVDANSAYDSSQGVELSRGLAKYNVGLLEQPVPRGDWAGMREVTRVGATPVMIDQGASCASEAAAICRDGVADAIAIKLTKMGTVSECARVLAVCEAFGVAAHLGGTAAPALVDSAACRFAAAHTGLSPTVEIGESLGLIGEAAQGFHIQDGLVRSNARPGLGVGAGSASLRGLRWVSGTG